MRANPLSALNATKGTERSLLCIAEMSQKGNAFGVMSAGIVGLCLNNHCMTRRKIKGDKFMA